MDVDSIGLGLDWVEVLRQAVASCKVMLVLIGPRWIEASAPHGGRRLDDPDDYVRLEIEIGLERAVRVVPILVGGGALPEPSELPESLRPLLRRQALELSDSTFRSDVGLLIERLANTLSADSQGQTPATPGPSPLTEWSVEPLRESHGEILLRVRLTHEQHDVRLNIADFREKIVVDGTIVISKWGGMIEGRQTFTMTDGPKTCTAVADINRTELTQRFKAVSLTIDGAPVYKWAA